MSRRTAPRTPSQSPIRVLVAPGFSTAEIVTRMRAAEPRLVFVSSTMQPLPNTEVVDIPSFRELGYDLAMEQLQATIKENRIDVLWAQGLSKHDLSPLVGCTVHSAATPEVYALVDDKARFQEKLDDDPARPGAIEAIGADAIDRAYKHYATQINPTTKKPQEVCIKPTIAVNGDGFQRFDEKAPAKIFMNPYSRVVHPAVYLLAQRLHEAQGGDPLRSLVMKYLPGPEVSIDILCDNGVPLIHAARTKIDSRRQLVSSEHPMIGHAYSLVRELGLHGVVSFQYRLGYDGLWYILEINARPAGGSTHSEDEGFGILSYQAKLWAGTIHPGDIVQRLGEFEHNKSS